MNMIAGKARGLAVALFSLICLPARGIWPGAVFEADTVIETAASWDWILSPRYNRLRGSYSSRQRLADAQWIPSWGAFGKAYLAYESAIGKIYETKIFEQDGLAHIYALCAAGSAGPWNVWHFFETSPGAWSSERYPAVQSSMQPALVLTATRRAGLLLFSASELSFWTASSGSWQRLATRSLPSGWLGSGKHEDVACDPLGRLHFVYEVRRQSSPGAAAYFQLNYLRWDPRRADAWTSEQVVVLGNTECVEYCLAVNAAGMPHLLYVQASFDSGALRWRERLYLTRRQENGTWSPLPLIDSSVSQTDDRDQGFAAVHCAVSSDNKVDVSYGKYYSTLPHTYYYATAAQEPYMFRYVIDRVGCANPVITQPKSRIVRDGSGLPQALYTIGLCGIKRAAPQAWSAVNGKVVLRGTGTGLSGMCAYLVHYISDDEGRTESVYTFTDAKGGFSFGNLLAGEHYRIIVYNQRGYRMEGTPSGSSAAYAYFDVPTLRPNDYTSYSFNAYVP